MNFLKRLLGKSCSHQFSWPRLYTDGRHYQTCTRCGICYEYDWNTMQLTNRVNMAVGLNSTASNTMTRSGAASKFPLAH